MESTCLDQGQFRRCGNLLCRRGFVPHVLSNVPEDLAFQEQPLIVMATWGPTRTLTKSEDHRV
jgi:hypothetical protein